MAKGTKHFPRLSYNVSRGLREIVAPIQTMPDRDWEQLLNEFNGCCAFCGEGPTQKNRGVVPDHLIPVTEHGELILGNVVPACQTCNDSRGNGNWREFLEARFPKDARDRSAIIDTYCAQHPYEAVHPETVLDPDELEQYQALLANWEALLTTARNLYRKVKGRRGIP